MTFIHQMPCKVLLLQSQIKFHNDIDIRRLKNTDVTYGGVASEKVPIWNAFIFQAIYDGKNIAFIEIREIRKSGTCCTRRSLYMYDVTVGRNLVAQQRNIHFQ